MMSQITLRSESERDLLLAALKEAAGYWLPVHNGEGEYSEAQRRRYGTLAKRCFHMIQRIEGAR